MEIAVLTWPAPERNKQPLLEVLKRVLPGQGTVLEIASGTGQHAAYFAAALPRLRWLPSDSEPRHLQAIAARVQEAGLANLAAPLMLDVHQRPWPVAAADALVCINLIHIAPWSATESLLEQAGVLLPAGGPLVLYGPYRRAGRHTAPGNEAFDANLRERNPAWGVRDMEAVEGLCAANGLVLQEAVPMPANNFTLVFRRAG